MSGLRAATLNLHGPRDRWFERRELIVADLIDQQPDIIGLQEVNRPLGQARWLKNQINSRITGKTKGPYQLAQRWKRKFAAGYFEGLAVLSKQSIISTDHLALGGGGYLALRVNVELPSRESLDFVTLQLATEFSSKELRLEQVLKLQGWLHRRDMTAAQIVAGDFSETPDELAIGQMKQVYRSAFEEFRGYEPVATYPTALMANKDGHSRCLDYVFLSAAAGKVAETQFFCHHPSKADPELYGSSHIGLLAEIWPN